MLFVVQLLKRHLVGLYSTAKLLRRHTVITTRGTHKIYVFQCFYYNIPGILFLVLTTTAVRSPGILASRGFKSNHSLQRKEVRATRHASTARHIYPRKPIHHLFHIRHATKAVYLSVQRARNIFLWGQVGRTGGAIPLPEPPSPSRASAPPVGESAKNGVDGENPNLTANATLAEKLHGAAASAAASASEVASTAANAVGTAGGGTANVRWERETFLLHLPDAEDLDVQGQEEDGGSGSGGDDGVVGGNGTPDLAGKSTLNDGEDSEDSESSTCDDGINLRVEVWQGRHCYGQVGVYARTLYKVSVNNCIKELRHAGKHTIKKGCLYHSHCQHRTPDMATNNRLSGKARRRSPWIQQPASRDLLST